jgi:ActR/RegA family two-component response regulator
MDKQKSVLIVEDHPLVAMALEGEFQSRGFRVTATARSIGEALSSLAEELPQLAIVDLNLGNDRATVLATALVRSGVRVAILSGDLAADALLAQVPHVYIPKPMEQTLVVDIAEVHLLTGIESSSTVH